MDFALQEGKPAAERMAGSNDGRCGVAASPASSRRLLRVRAAPSRRPSVHSRSPFSRGGSSFGSSSRAMSRHACPELSCDAEHIHQGHVGCDDLYSSVAVASASAVVHGKPSLSSHHHDTLCICLVHESGTRMDPTCYLLLLTEPLLRRQTDFASMQCTVTVHNTTAMCLAPPAPQASSQLHGRYRISPEKVAGTWREAKAMWLTT